MVSPLNNNVPEGRSVHLILGRGKVLQYRGVCSMYIMCTTLSRYSNKFVDLPIQHLIPHYPLSPLVPLFPQERHIYDCPP